MVITPLHTITILMALQLKKGKQKVTHGRCSDVLVKDDNAWEFVAWHCADEAKKY
jgi:hypothetical protein